MFTVEMYVRVRRACLAEGMSVREASRVFGLHRDTVRKMLAYSVPPGERARHLRPGTKIGHQAGPTVMDTTKLTGLLALGTSKKTRRIRSHVINASTVQPQPTSLVRIIRSCARSPSSRRGYAAPPTVQNVQHSGEIANKSSGR